MGSNYAAAPSAITTAATTNFVTVNTNATVQPSTGKIVGGGYVLKTPNTASTNPNKFNAEMVYNSTNNCIDFVFL